MKSKYPSQNQDITPWDDEFKQLMRDTLSELGVQVIAEHKLGKFPLKADLVLIFSQKTNCRWKQQPIWQHRLNQGLIAFKEIADTFCKWTRRAWQPCVLIGFESGSLAQKNL